jgi:hypothetical protein
MRIGENSAKSTQMAVPYPELCRRIRDGDRAAEEVLVRSLEPGLRLAAWRATRRDPDLTQELCQETVVIMLADHWKRFVNHTDFYTFTPHRIRNVDSMKLVPPACRTGRELRNLAADAKRRFLKRQLPVVAGWHKKNYPVQTRERQGIWRNKIAKDAGRLVCGESTHIVRLGSIPLTIAIDLNNSGFVQVTNPAK